MGGALGRLRPLPAVSAHPTANAGVLDALLAIFKAVALAALIAVGSVTLLGFMLVVGCSALAGVVPW